MSRTSRKRHAPRLLSLCTGIGGIDLAAEMAGWEIAGQCEIDPFCQQVLARHWPDVKRVADIRSVWGDSFDGAIDCIAAGFPCQPASVAGQRRGSADARWLWPEVLRVIQVYEPAWLLLENVAGLISLGLDTVLADLAASGYEAWPLVFPAAAVGAPHLRERVFVVAHSNHCRRGGVVAGVAGSSSGRSDDAWSAIERGSEAVADANRDRRPQPQGRVGEFGRWVINGGEEGNILADADSDRCGNGAHQPLAVSRGCGAPDVGAAGCAAPCVAVEYARSARREERDSSRVAGDAGHPARRHHQGSQGSQGSRPDGRHRQPESGVGGNADGLPGRLDGDRRYPDLMPPRHAWPALRGEAQHRWEPPRTTAERIPNRARRIAALGNGVVLQQVYPLLAAMRLVIEGMDGMEVIS